MSSATISANAKTDAEAIVNKYVPWSMGSGLIPIPIADFAAITAVQLKMLSEMSAVYGVEFKENRGKSIIVSLISSAGSTTLAVGSLGSLIKAIPGFGQWLGGMTLPIIAGALTYAVGKVFIQHFESGGDFLNFDDLAAKQAFVEAYESGKQEAAAVGKKVDAKLSSAFDL